MPRPACHLLLDCTHASLLFCRPVVRIGSTLLPHMEDSGSGTEIAGRFRGRLSDASDSCLLLLEFMQFVNITVPPDVRRDLFT